MIFALFVSTGAFESAMAIEVSFLFVRDCVSAAGRMWQLFCHRNDRHGSDSHGYRIQQHSPCSTQPTGCQAQLFKASTYDPVAQVLVRHACAWCTTTRVLTCCRVIEQSIIGCCGYSQGCDGGLPLFAAKCVYESGLPSEVRNMRDRAEDTCLC